MDSATKNRQDAATLRRMIARAYGSAQVPATDDFYQENTEGWFNAVYVLTLADSTRCVLKIAPPAGMPVNSREIGMMRREVEIMRLIAERTRVPVPRVHHADFTGEVIASDWFTMEFIEGINFGLGADEGVLAPDVVADGRRQVGALNAAINEVTGPHFGPVLGQGTDSWREAFSTIMEEVLTDCLTGGVDLGWSHDEIRAVIAEHAGALDEVTVPRLVETDLWDKNTIWRDGRIVAVVDHERALWGDVLMEGGFTGIDLETFPDPTDFAAGYGLDLSALSPTELTRRHLYTLWTGAIIAAETGFRGYRTDELLHVGRQILTHAMGLLGRRRLHGAQEPGAGHGSPR